MPRWSQYVESLLSGDAQPRHQASSRIIDSGVDHLAVARGCSGPDVAGRFHHHNLKAGLRQPPCSGEADNRAGHDALNSVHRRSTVLERFFRCSFLIQFAALRCTRR
jgi:hypothetical protein